MKNILKQTVIGVMSLALTASVLPAQDFHNDHRGGAQVQAASWRNGDAYRDDRYRGDDRYRADDRDRYYDRDHHYGRDTAVVVGSAAGGALIGAAAGHGQGAVIGAIVGGVGGLIADEAVHHHR